MGKEKNQEPQGELVAAPKAAEELIVLETETSKPQFFACRDEDGEKQNALASILCGERYSLYRTGNVTLNVTAYMDGMIHCKSRIIPGEREWKRVALFVADDGQVWSTGSEFVIRQFRRMLAIFGNKMPQVMSLRFYKFRLDTGNECLRMAFSRKSTVVTSTGIVESPDDGPSDQAESSSDEVPF